MAPPPPPPQAKRCLYEVLGVSQVCTAAEIRSAYRKLALQRHPDKLVQTGVSESDATAAFQELLNAYEVLSDPRERSWYDSNRDKILYSGSSYGSNSSSKYDPVPNVFPFFSNSVYSGFSDTGKGFYKVYADIFDKVYSNELNFAKKSGLAPPKEAPLMGNMESPYAQVTAFYNYWLGFATVMDFCWADRNVVVPEMIRKFRREMEDENTKLRKKARKEYNEAVRGLAEFVKKRDKRVIQMQAKRNEEMEKKKLEEKARKKELEMLKAEKAKMYKEPDWTRIDNVEDEAVETWDKNGDDKKEELYCIACGKKFKSEKQWKNHEQSKKHKERIAVLREALSDEDKVLEELDVNERRKEEDQKTPESEENGYFSASDDVVDELGEQFEGSFGFQGNSDGQESEPPTGKSGCTSDVPDSDDGDEDSILEAMVSGHRSRQHMGFSHHSKMKNDDLNFMEYNYSKASGRKRGSRKQRNRRAKDGMSFNNETDDVESSGQVAKYTVNDEHMDIDESADNDARPKCTVYDENVDAQAPSLQVSPKTKADAHEDDSLDAQAPSLQVSPKTKADAHEDDSLDNVGEIPRQAAIGKKANKKKDNNKKSKNASKGRKEKATSRRSDSACEKCGEEFESRNKLHNHLGESGHSSIKSR